MKVFEVTIQKDRSNPDECGFAWPAWWGEVCQKVDVVAYQDEGLSQEGAICVCDDETAKKIFDKKDPLVTELTELEANTKGREWKPQLIRVNDEQSVLLLTAKVARGETLTAEEKKVLDPDDPTSGVSKSKLFDIAQIIADKEK